MEGIRHSVNHSRQEVEEGVLVVGEFQNLDDQGLHWAVVLDGMVGNCVGSPCPLLDLMATPAESVPPHPRKVTQSYLELSFDDPMRAGL